MNGKRVICSAVICLCSLALASAVACGTGNGALQQQSDSSTAISETVGSVLDSSETLPANAATSAAGDYATTLFDDGFVHEIDIAISDEDWADLLANPLDKTKYHADVTIDGETVEDVSFATKGNTSLSAVAADDSSNRYSFKVSFGKYVDGQTYHGLDKLNLSNAYADATYMKDYLSYRLFREAGVESPLVSYVWLTVNGEDFGLYVAIEEVGDSYLERAQNGEGELYKPESEILAMMDMARTDADMQAMENGQQTEPPGGMPEGSAAEGPGPEQGGAPSPSAPGAPGGPGEPNAPEAPTRPDSFDDSTSAASLTYIDDDLNSYAEIFDNAETDATEEDERRVIAALKALSEGNCEQALDTSEVIRYFAAHNFVLNYDSYTGTMLHNYYLYEKNGKLSMLPWDYNLAFSSFSGGPGSPGSPGAPTGPGEGTSGPGGPDGAGSPNGSGENGPLGPNESTGPEASIAEDATSLVNTGIDSPLSGTTESARPMWAWIASSDEYRAQYHNALDELVADYFESGLFESEIDALHEMLLPYVQKDPSAFYTADEFEQAYSTLKRFCLMRTQSIRAQLDGSLAPISTDQSSDSRVSADGINIDDMGTQNPGRGV